MGIGTAVFTGYVLHLGSDASYISPFTFVAYMLATVQLLMPVPGRYLRGSRVIISVGMVEIALRSSPPLVPLLFAPHMQLPAHGARRSRPAVRLLALPLLQHLGGQCRARQHTGPVHEPPDDRQHPRVHDRRLQRRLHAHQHPRLLALGQPRRPLRQHTGTADPDPARHLPARSCGCASSCSTASVTPSEPAGSTTASCPRRSSSAPPPGPPVAPTGEHPRWQPRPRPEGARRGPHGDSEHGPRRRRRESGWPEESARQLAGILRDGLSATGRPPTRCSPSTW